jgi:hypothetical protein
MDDRDTWQMANLLLKEYGGEAAFIAARRADALLDQGDTEGLHRLVAGDEGN